MMAHRSEHAELAFMHIAANRRGSGGHNSASASRLNERVTILPRANCGSVPVRSGSHSLHISQSCNDWSGPRMDCPLCGAADVVTNSGGCDVGHQTRALEECRSS
jgi:hypothetical protein